MQRMDQQIAVEMLKNHDEISVIFAFSRSCIVKSARFCHVFLIKSQGRHNDNKQCKQMKMLFFHWMIAEWSSNWMIAIVTCVKDRQSFTIGKKSPHDSSPFFGNNFNFNFRASIFVSPEKKNVSTIHKWTIITQMNLNCLLWVRPCSQMY